MYTEATQKKPYSRAILETKPSLRHGSDRICVEFWYHMYGVDMGTLAVYFRQEGLNSRILWAKYGRTISRKDYIFNIYQIEWQLQSTRVCGCGGWVGRACVGGWECMGVDVDVYVQSVFEYLSVSVALCMQVSMETKDIIKKL